MASISFPSSPSNGDTYSYDGLTYQYNSTKNKWSVVATTTITDVQADSISASLSPSANVTYDLGTSEKSFRDLYLSGSTIHLGSQQISSNSTGVILPEGSLVGTSEIGSGSGVTVYANASILPTTGLTSGEMAYTGNAIFITNGSGWYRIAVVNQDPSITLSQDSISLGTGGNTIFFTYTTTDPDGTTPTVTLSNTGIANTTVANLNLYTANNTVRIDNFSATDWEGTITLTASDGISTAFDSLTVSVSYLSEYWDETALSIGTSSTNSLDNDTFIDRSTNAYTVTPNGTPVQTAFHPYLDNYSASFTGDGSYLSLPASSDFHFDTGDYTVECWVNPNDVSGTLWVAGIWSYTAPSYQSWGIYISGGKWNHTIDPADTVINTSTSNAVAGVWTHIAIVRSGDAFKLFVNGVLESDVTSAGYNMAEGGGYMGIGQVHNGAAGVSTRGQIADFHVIKGYAKYTSTFTPPTEPVTPHVNTVLLTCRKNRFYDESTSNKTITVNGSNVSVSAFNPFGQDSEYALGGNKGSVKMIQTAVQYLTTPQTAALSSTLLASNFTIEAWIYLEEYASVGSSHIWNNTEANLDGQTALYIYSDGRIMFGKVGVNEIGSTSGTIKLHQWHHVAMVRNGATTRVYVDGADVANGASSTYLNSSNVKHMKIGRSSQTSGDNSFPGYISDFKVTASAVYTSAFTPPTSPVGNTNAVLYLPMDNTGIFDKTGNDTLSLNGNVATSTTQTKHADTAIYFGGTAQTDYIRSNKLFGEYFSAAATEIFTIEAWINLEQNNAFPTYQWHNAAIFACSPGYFVFGVDVNNKIVFYHNDGSQRNWTPGSNTISLNTWHHVAVCSDGAGGLKTFVDGIQDATGTYYGLQSASATATVELGVSGFSNSNERAFQGYIENFQILKGVAKYTANFTPPTQTQGRTYQASS